MGRKLDALLGRNLRTSKFKTLAKLTISRTAILKNQRQVRCSHARSDVIELLNLGHQERALLRVEHVIKEQNMLDVFAMIDNYCNLLIERVALLQKSKECPDELKEGISSLIFANSRCGEFPELQKIREILTSRFGKDFAYRSIELHNNCGVNPKMIQKLSARQPSLEVRLKMLKEIASEIGVTLHLEEDAHVIVEEKQDINQKQNQLEPNKSGNLESPPLRINGHESAVEEIIQDDKFSESMKARKKYTNAAAAAQEAFESAAYAAAAARAAVELSRSKSRDNDPDDHSGSTHRQGTRSNFDGLMTPKVQSDGYAASEEIEHSNNIFGFDKIHPIDNSSSKEMVKINHSIKPLISKN
ncbi:uncharacterized protein LOC142622064 [Castanea sativa]|uniref:uncharacterized protein LOC142622064 n=1 Tax=Castanea sativa TaxID=21020 RepID=UPI003F649F37